MATHEIVFHVKYVMHDMTGTSEQSAEIAYEQVSCALQGEESQYGWPYVHAKDVNVVHHTGDDGEDAIEWREARS